MLTTFSNQTTSIEKNQEVVPEIFIQTAEDKARKQENQIKCFLSAFEYKINVFYQLVNMTVI